MLTGKESKGTDAVIEVDKDNVVTGLLNDFAAVIVAIRIVGVSAPLNEQPDREVGIRTGIPWPPDIDK